MNEQPLSGSLHTLDLNRHPGELCAGIVALTQENANVTKLPAHAGALTVSPDFVGARGGRIGQRPFVGRGRLGRILSPQSCCFQIRLLRGWGKIHVELFLALADRKADRAVLSLYGFFFGHGLTLALLHVRYQLGFAGIHHIKLQLVNDTIDLGGVLGPDGDFDVMILGRGLTGDVIVDIDKTPHILIGGNTGSGKSVLVQCLLWQAIQQADVVYVADFKGGVDFSYVWQEFAYIITEETKLLVLLNHLADTLEERKRLFKEVDAANITEYREKSGDYMQRIVFACDEVAELLDKTGADKARKELLAQIEARLALIARQGRAFGIHLILATQRPDANILPGQIKNNMNIRICGRADTTLSTIIIGDGRAAEQIPHDAQGRFIMEDGTVFQAYYFNDDTISKW